MSFKFERLEVWQLSLEYVDLVYQLTEQLPKHEQNNLKSQLVRAATSISLNIAEGSTGQTNAEQARFLGIAIRSLIETVACQHLIYRRGYLSDIQLLRTTYKKAKTLAAKLHTMRHAVKSTPDRLRESSSTYDIDRDESPFS